MTVKPMSADTPVYTIGVAAHLLNVHPRTLRIYEDEGLIKPARRGNRRFFSANDLTWISCIRTMIHDDGISIPGIKKLLRFAPCWEIADCPRDVCESCTARIDIAIPRTLHIAGDENAVKEAKKKDIAVRKKKSSNSAGQKTKKIP